AGPRNRQTHHRQPAEDSAGRLRAECCAQCAPIDKTDPWEDAYMIISRAGFLRGLAASAVLPTAALAAPPTPTAGLFLPDGALDGPIQWKGAPAAGAGPLRFVVIGDNTGLARPGVFD